MVSVRVCGGGGGVKELGGNNGRIVESNHVCCTVYCGLSVWVVVVHVALGTRRSVCKY